MAHWAFILLCFAALIVLWVVAEIIVDRAEERSRAALIARIEAANENR